MEPKKKRLGSGRVAFLARKEEIKTKIEAGYTMVSVYEEYEKQLGISYGQFVNYINKFIRSKPDESQGTKPAAPVTKPIRARTPDQPAFISSPTPRDDLIHPKPKG